MANKSLLLALAFVSAAFAQAVGIGNVTIAPGGAANASITLVGMDDFGAADITLYYGPGVIEVKSASLGFSGYGGFFVENINNTAGKSKFVMFTTAMPGPNSPLKLVNLELKAVGLAGKESDLVLGLEVITLSYTNGTEIIPKVSNGTVTILGTAQTQQVSVGTFTTAVGSNVTVPVVVGNAGLIAGGSVKLVFNPAIANAAGVSSGNFPGSIVSNINNTAGFVFVAVSGTAAVGRASATLANVTFTGVSAGTSSLSFASASLNYQNGTLVTPTALSGSISVTGATGKIRGTVRDFLTSQPVPYAYMEAYKGGPPAEVPRPAASATADAAGTYVISGLEPGPYALAVSRVNYCCMQPIKDVVVESGATTEYDVSLIPLSQAAGTWVLKSFTEEPLEATVLLSNGSANFSLKATPVKGVYVFTVPLGLNYSATLLLPGYAPLDMGKVGFRSGGSYVMESILAGELKPSQPQTGQPAQPLAQPPAQQPTVSQDYALITAGIAVVAIIAAIAFFLVRRKPGVGVPPKGG